MIQAELVGYFCKKEIHEKINHPDNCFFVYSSSESTANRYPEVRGENEWEGSVLEQGHS